MKPLCFIKKMYFHLFKARIKIIKNISIDQSDEQDLFSLT